MDRPTFPARKARDLAGLLLLVAGILTVLISAWRWDPLAGAAVTGLGTAVGGYLLGRE